MQSYKSKAQEIDTLEAAAFAAAQAGRDHEALGHWTRILALEPDHVRTLTALGQRSFRNGDMQSARARFERLAELESNDAQRWIHLAVACRALKDEPAEEQAIQRALSVDPTDLAALILRADLVDRQGKEHEAAIAHSRVAAVSPPIDRLRPELRAAVARAFDYCASYNQRYGTFLDQFLEPYFKQFEGESLKRFRDSVDIMVARKRRYDSKSLIYHFPNLAPIEFFDRADFPWIGATESATDEIREEFLGTLRGDEGFQPYIAYPPDVPHNQFAELNNSPRWSAFHLYKMGKLIEENAAKCPATMRALALVPQPDQPGRTPSAMFSLLKPHTRIPAHNGVTNVRLVTHLALIVPEGCGFRVGNETRQWVPGKAWVFDDTIEHEAWNDSDKLRVVLIFDVWHPQLSLAERALITALTRGMNEYTGGTAMPEI